MIWTILAALTAPILALQAASSVPSSSVDLQLVCYGVADKQSSHINTRSYHNQSGKRHRSREDVIAVTERTETAVTVQFLGDTGRISLPKSFVPDINNGGSGGGWWPLTNISISESEIRAGYKLNFLDRPRFRIDRNTGIIEMKDLSVRFTGRCDATEPGERRF